MRPSLRLLPWPVLAVSVFLAGCSTGAGVSPVPSSDLFIVVREGTTSAQLPAAVAAEARAEAANHCEAHGRAMEEVDAQATKTWNATGNVPVFKMRFRCVPRPVPATQATHAGQPAASAPP